jgi:hypothetical protein
VRESGTMHFLLEPRPRHAPITISIRVAAKPTPPCSEPQVEPATSPLALRALSSFCLASPHIQREARSEARYRTQYRSAAPVPSLAQLCGEEQDEKFREVDARIRLGC